MAREVCEIIRLFDEDGIQIRNFVLDTQGFSIENTRFLMTYMSEDIDKFIYEVNLYYSLIKFLMLENITVNIPNFDDNVKTLDSLYHRLEAKYPNKLKRIKKETQQYKFGIGYVVNVYDSFIDNKINNVSFFINDEDGEYTEKYPIIPELAGKLFCKTMYGSTFESIDKQMLNLNIAKIYFSLLYDYFQDKKFYDMGEDIDEKLYDYESEYPEKAQLIKEGLTYIIEENISMCNDIELFATHLIISLIKNKDIKALDELHEILSFADTDNPRFDEIVELIKVFISNHSGNDELKCFVEMKDKYTNMFITTTFVSYLHSFSVTEEYKNLFNNNGDNQRTLD